MKDNFLERYLLGAFGIGADNQETSQDSDAERPNDPGRAYEELRQLVNMIGLQTQEERENAAELIKSKVDEIIGKVGK